MKNPDRAAFVAALAAKGIKDPAIKLQERIVAGTEPQWVVLVKGKIGNITSVMVRDDSVAFHIRNGWRLP